MTIVTAATMKASREAVWRTFLDVERWPEWSPWRLEFGQEPRLTVGAPFRVTLPAPWLPFLTMKFPCRVSVLEEQYVICWTGSVLGVPGYHRFSLSDLPEGCQVLSEEEFRGPLTPLLRPVRGMIEAHVREFLSRLGRAARTNSK